MSRWLHSWEAVYVVSTDPSTRMLNFSPLTAAAASEAKANDLIVNLLLVIIRGAKMLFIGRY